MTWKEGAVIHGRFCKRIFGIIRCALNEQTTITIRNNILKLCMKSELDKTVNTYIVLVVGGY